MLYYLLFCNLQKENENLKKEVKGLIEELLETNTGVLALLQEIEKNSNELLINDKQKTEFLEKLKKSNREQVEKIKVQEQALIQADKMASLGQLVAGVAHEINNPTTYIRANIELLQKYLNIMWKNGLLISDDATPYVEEFKDTFESMYKGTDRIMDIISGLKFFVRQEKVSYEAFDLYGCITEAYKLVKNEFVRNKVSLRSNIEKDQFLIYGSRQQLEQIFINLFLNSIKAIKADDLNKAGFVEISVMREGISKLLISVRDNGCGIDEKNLNNIFNPFFTTNQDSGGTGLGLSIVYGIIREHGGDIQVKSTVNQGTEFIITLPEHQLRL